MIKKLYLDSYFTKQQMRRGLDRIYIDFENIKADASNPAETLAKVILRLVQDDVITHQVLLKMPPEIREEIEAYKPFAEFFEEDLKVFGHETQIKEKFAELVMFYLDSYNSNDIIDHLQNLGHSEIVRPWLIRKAILISCGKGNKEREMVSKLLKELAENLKMNYAMYSYAFDHCIQNVQDYKLDIPNFPEYLSMFIARAIFDGYFCGTYILHAETFDSSDEDQLMILKNACSYLTLFPLEHHLANIWG